MADPRERGYSFSRFSMGRSQHQRVLIFNVKNDYQKANVPLADNFIFKQKLYKILELTSNSYTYFQSLM